MRTVFLAYASGNDFHDSILRESAAQASDDSRKIIPWTEKDTSGQQISRTVESWIDECDTFIGDVSTINMNVTYEVGYAIGSGKSVRLIRSTHIDFEGVKKIGLLDTLGYDSYDFHPKLRAIFKKDDMVPSWHINLRNKDQPIFVLQPPSVNDVSRTFISGIKKIARYKFRGFNPAEISRLNATEAYEQSATSFGVVGFWLDSTDDNAIINNQRVSFIFGVARGAGIPAVLIAHESSRLPLDLHDSAARWGRMEDLDTIVSEFRNRVAEEIIQFSTSESRPSGKALETIEFGDPVAENEQSQLRHFFIETDSFIQAMEGRAHILVGRKGSGKSAVFFQMRDRSRSNKNNIVVDLMPDGYQLIKLKEFVLDKLSFGARKEVIAAFWEYIIWLEIAYKLLEKDQSKSKYDSRLLERYRRLEGLFYSRVDTGVGDFSERLRLLADNIIKRFSEHVGSDESLAALKSSEVLEIIYGQDLRILRDEVLEYLQIKGFVLFLFDNLDRIWTPGGFTAGDADILVGLAEAMQEITRKFSKRRCDFRWILFVRSDVYEFLIAGMADYGKLSTQSLEWSDRDQLVALFNQRLISSDGINDRAITIKEISVAIVDGKSVLDFMIDGCMMRPRYLIRLFETARRRALALGRSEIAENDYNFALVELGWQALEDLDREIVDLVPSARNLLFELLEHRDNLTPDAVRYIASRHVSEKEVVEKLIEIMVWSGSLGVDTQNGVRYIFNTGYKRQFIAALIRSNGNVKLKMHPTLCATME